MKKEHISLQKEQCCGCGLCGEICPTKAISYVKDELGFYYAEVTEEKCIHCGKCVDRCPIQGEFQGVAPEKCLAAVNNQKDVLQKSASGGIFAALATTFLQEGGIVYGAAMLSQQEGLSVSHIRIDSMADLPKLQGSKYVQSNVEHTFSQVKQDLKEGKKVLFSGSPCQVASMRKFVGGNNNLLLVDVICHGVPSQQMFADYLKTLTKKKGQAVSRFSFRTKKQGWGLCASAELKAANGKSKIKMIPCQISSYYTMFLHCEIYRDSCYQCAFARQERVGDLTLGDFWGIEKAKDVYKTVKEHGVDITEGVSCVLVNTECGFEWIKKSDIFTVSATFEQVALENGQLSHPSACPTTRETIASAYVTGGYKALDKKFNQRLGLRKQLILLKKKMPAGFRLKGKIMLQKIGVLR